jgi:NAD(P)-dependent dehydrogenase (short-subunit alcohol dehydrogenase family)
MREAVLTGTGTGEPVDAQVQSGTKTRRVTVITGASGGIGADLARVLASHGHELVLIARSHAPLEALAGEIEASGRPRPLVLAFDLLERGAPAQIAAALKAAGAAPEILVNNAGFGLIGPAAELDPAGQLAILDLNIRSVVDLTLQLLPAIRAARGKILNVASVAAYFLADREWLPIMRRNPLFSRSRSRFRRNCARTASRSRLCVPATPRPGSRPEPVSDRNSASHGFQAPAPCRSPKLVMPG